MSEQLTDEQLDEIEELAATWHPTGCVSKGSLYSPGYLVEKIPLLLAELRRLRQDYAKFLEAAQVLAACNPDCENEDCQRARGIETPMVPAVTSDAVRATEFYDRLREASTDRGAWYIPGVVEYSQCAALEQLGLAETIEEKDDEVARHWKATEKGNVLLAALSQAGADLVPKETQQDLAVAELIAGRILGGGFYEVCMNCESCVHYRDRQTCVQCIIKCALVALSDQPATPGAEKETADEPD